MFVPQVLRLVRHFVLWFQIVPSGNWGLPRLVFDAGQAIASYLIHADLGELFLNGRSHFGFWKMFKFRVLALNKTAFQKLWRVNDAVTFLVSAKHALLALAGFLAILDMFFGSELPYNYMG